MWKFWKWPHKELIQIRKLIEAEYRNFGHYQKREKCGLFDIRRTHSKIYVSKQKQFFHRSLRTHKANSFHPTKPISWIDVSVRIRVWPFGILQSCWFYINFFLTIYYFNLGKHISNKTKILVACQKFAFIL